MPDHQFISYAKKDGQKFALKLRHALQEALPSIHGWLDDFDIPAGKVWDVEIERAIKSCQTLLFVITKQSVKSKECRNEWALALDLDKSVVPLLVDEAAHADIPMRLREIQYINFTGEFESALARLVETVSSRRSQHSQALRPFTQPVDERENQIWDPTDLIREVTDYCYEYRRRKSPDWEHLWLERIQKRQSIDADLVPLYLSLPESPVAVPCSIMSALEDVSKERRLFVEGEPGSGKSTLAIMTALRMARGEWKLSPETVSLRQPIPLVFDLPEFEEWQNHLRPATPDVAGLDEQFPVFGRWFAHKYRTLVREPFRSAFGTGSYVFLFDTLDEVGSTDNFIADLLHFCDSAGKDWVVILGRPGSFSKMPRPYPKVVLKPLDPFSQMELLRLRLGDSEARILWPQLNHVNPALREKPLILSIIAQLWKQNTIPDRWDDVSVYGQIVSEMLGPYTDIRIGNDECREHTGRVKLFEAFCASYMEDSSPFFSSKTFGRVGHPPYEVEPSVDSIPSSVISAKSPLLPGPKGNQKPLHRSFAEFGYARFLVERSKSDVVQRLITHWSQYADSVAPDFFVRMDDSERVLNFLQTAAETAFSEHRQGHPTKLLSLARVAYCVPKLEATFRKQIRAGLFDVWSRRSKEGDRIESSAAATAARCLGSDLEIVQRECQKLTSDFPEIRHAAMDLVSAMDSPLAIPYLLRLISHEDNRIRFYCVISLGRRVNEEIVQALIDRWDQESDWDLLMTIVESGSRLPSPLFGDLLAKARSRSHPIVPAEEMRVVRWEAEMMYRLRDEKGLVGSVAASSSLELEATEVDWHGQELSGKILSQLRMGSPDDRFTVGAAILRGATVRGEFGTRLREHLTTRLLELLGEDREGIEDVWINARALREILCVNSGINRYRLAETLVQVLTKLSPEKHTYARGEIARMLGALRSPNVIEKLCAAFSTENDAFERLWIMHTVWELIPSLEREEDLHLVLGFANDAIRSEGGPRGYHRAKFFAELARDRVKDRLK